MNAFTKDFTWLALRGIWFSAALWTLPVSAQDILAAITAANAPIGTPAAPHYVIDSDAANAGAGYDRNAIPASFGVLYSRAGGVTSATMKFRARVQLVGPDGIAVALANANDGPNAIVSASENISLSNFTPFASRTYSFLPRPAVDLGAGGNYTLRYTVQREATAIIGGNPVTLWLTSAGPQDSSAFTTVHFRDFPENSLARRVRAYPTGTPSWTKTYLITTGTLEPAPSFTASVPYFAARYDVGGSNAIISYRLTATVTDDTGAVIALQNGGQSTSLLSMQPSVATSPLTPRTYSGNFTASFRPVSQLDSRNRTFRIKIRIEHIESTSPTTYLDDGESSQTVALQRLLHFNGILRFGTLDTVFSAISNAPTAGALGTNLVNTSLSVTSGSISSVPGYTFGNGSALAVQLLSNGDSVVTSGSQPVIVAGGGNVSSDFNGVTVVYPNTSLTSSGPVASAATVRLPQGLSYTPNRNSAAGRYESEVTIGGPFTLTNQFRHSGSLTLSLSANAWVFDEARPLLYQVSNFAFRQAGEIEFAAVTSEWIHQQGFDQIEQQQSDGQHENPGMATRLSNDGYLRFSGAAAGSKLSFAAASDLTARCLKADLGVDPGSFTTHFPHGTHVAWAASGEIQILNGLIEPGSHLRGVDPLVVSYDGSCADDDCGPGGGTVVAITLESHDGRLNLTADGGLQTPGPIIPADLKWGIRGDFSFTHLTDIFSQGHFLASGNQLYQELNPVAASGPQKDIARDLGPGIITLAGFDPATPGMPVYSRTNGYRDGTGVWPGATVIVENPGHVGASRIADQAAPYPYILQQQVSKYYVRRSGLSGRHVAQEKSFDPDLALYGYQFNFSRYQLTFLSNKNERSWINGSVIVPHPSDFNQSFRELMLSCTGSLESAEIDPDDAGPKDLAYWSGSFTPLAMRFAPQAGAPCGAPRYLTLGLISGAANINSPLAGTLAFKNDGNIGTLAENIEGADGRLGLPAIVQLAGPGTETYKLNPVTKLYFNNPETAGAPDTGFVSFAATCGVPYFEDLRVHVMTSAKSGLPAPVYLASNWTSSGHSHFTNTLFDGTHRGFPDGTGDGITVGEYQKPTSATNYRVRAQQSLFGIVPLDYPLRWSSTARFFDSWEAEQNDLLVLKVEHQIDYLSADNAEISFGAQYEGLPKISLASAATEIVDGQLGAARALTEAARSFVTGTLNQGIDEIGTLVNDSMETVLDRAISEIEREVINPLYEAVVTSYGDAVTSNQTYNAWLNQGSGDLKLVFNRYLDGTLGPPADSIKGRLQQLSAASAEASSLIVRVQDAVEAGILTIDSIAGRLELLNGEVQFNIAIPNGTVLPSGSPAITGIVNGLLAKVPGPNGPERELVQRLVAELIKELAPPDLAAVLISASSELNDELNDQLNELLAKFDPTLNRVTQVLMEARAYLEEIHSQLEQGVGIVNSFDQIITNATSEINTMMNGIRATAYGFIDQMVAQAALPTNTALGQIGSVIDQFSKEEFVALIRAELRDRLLATEFIRSIQYQLRQTISEFDIALRSAIDSAFAEVNRMCRELIKEALGPIDDKINGLLGSINSVVGAGSVDGYAHIQGDTLRRLRIDAMVELKVPDALKLQAYLEMLCYDSSTDTGTAGCLAKGSQAVEVRIGALDVPLDWISPDLRANLDVWFSMQTEPSLQPLGIGGGFAMTGGELKFQTFKITEFAAGVAVGSNEAYIAAAARVIISEYEASGGIFFGRTCSLAPLEMIDPDVAEVLGTPPFTGAYVYGEIWLPISETLLGIPATCFFRISAGVGAGAFYFVEGPTFGGKILLGASGEALCLVSIKGTVTMIGVMKNGALAFSGKGKLQGKAGACPFCVKFGKTAKVKYEGGSWSVDL